MLCSCAGEYIFKTPSLPTLYNTLIEPMKAKQGIFSALCSSLDAAEWRESYMPSISQHGIHVATKDKCVLPAFAIGPVPFC